MFKASNTTFEIHVIRRFRAQMPGKTALVDLILLLFLKEGKPYNETALTVTVQCTKWIARHSVDNQDGVRTVHTYMQRSIRIEPPQRPLMVPVRFDRTYTHSTRDAASPRGTHPSVGNEVRGRVRTRMHNVHRMDRSRRRSTRRVRRVVKIPTERFRQAFSLKTATTVIEIQTFCLQKQCFL